MHANITLRMSAFCFLVYMCNSVQVAEQKKGKEGVATPTVVTETMLEDILGVKYVIFITHLSEQ